MHHVHERKPLHRLRHGGAGGPPRVSGMALFLFRLAGGLHAPALHVLHHTARMWVIPPPNMALLRRSWRQCTDTQCAASAYAPHPRAPPAILTRLSHRSG